MKEYKNVNSVTKTETTKKRTSKKNLIYCIAAASVLLCSQTIKAQITLEHTFNDYVEFSGTHMGYDYRGDVGLFIYQDCNQIKLYNTDYSLYKSINISLADYDCFSVYYFTKELFNNDNKIEFLVMFEKWDETDWKLTCKSILYNEDATILKDFGESIDGFTHLIYKVEEQYKLFVYRTDSDGKTTTEIYSLPGKTTSIAPPTGNNISKSPYPNPTNATITLPYKLNQGETSMMHIYNTNGQLIETQQIDAAFDKILLNVSRYTKGMYLYEVNGVSKRFVVH
jgi:hypothetical protein